MSYPQIEDIGLTSHTYTKHVNPDSGLMEEFVGDMLEVVMKEKKLTKEYIDKLCSTLKTKYRVNCSKSNIREMYQREFSSIKVPLIFKNWMIKKATRSTSGILVVTITLSPHKFSCMYNCHYCPQETDLAGKPTQPRSYLSSEPAMMRALGTRVSKDTYDFDVKNQFRNRIQSYLYTGTIRKDDTNSRKMEIILSGGTWESYPLEYREQVMNELYWSANTIESDRPMKTLEEEIRENETAKYRIIGLTLETRPDNITPQSILQYCRWGVTRMQIGVQHFDDMVLKKINRKCTTADTIRAIHLLKQAGFKVVVHLMPDLPGSTPALDTWMFEEALTNPALQFDDVKIYPTAVCKSSDPELIVNSKIAEWYSAGLYTPYAEKNLDELLDVLTYYKTRIQPWIRIQRLVRDIPAKSIESGYNKMSNLRQILHDRMRKNGSKCNCTFCMEIGDRNFSGDPILVVRKYEASGGTEYYLSMEAHVMTWWQRLAYWFDRIVNFVTWIVTGRWSYWSGNLDSYVGLYGFLRLRHDPSPGGGYIPELRGCALIREVHVYGFSLGVGNDTENGAQHLGYGRLLVRTAENISRKQGYAKSAVIAGVGTREYYKNKCGYSLSGTYMVKDI